MLTKTRENLANHLAADGARNTPTGPALMFGGDVDHLRPARRGDGPVRLACSAAGALAPGIASA